MVSQLSVNNYHLKYVLLGELTALLHKYGVSAQQLEKQCAEAVACMVASQIIEYEVLGMYLGLSRSKIHEIKQDHSTSCQQRKINIILKWIDKEGSDATELALVDVLLRMEEKHIAELVIVKHSKRDHTALPACKDFQSWDEKLSEKLKEDNKEVIHEYRSLALRICTLLSKNADLRLVKDSILDAGYVSLHKQIENELDNTKVAGAIRKHSNWCNYELLELVIDGLDNGRNDCKAEFQAYKDKWLYPYLERAIFKIPPNSLGSGIQRDDEVLLYLKIFDDIKLSGDNVKLLQRNLQRRLKQPSLTLKTYEKGCIQIVFSIDWCSWQSKEIPSTLPIRQISQREHYVEIASLM